MSQPRPKPNLSPKAVPGLEAKCSFVVRNQTEPLVHAGSRGSQSPAHGSCRTGTW